MSRNNSKKPIKNIMLIGLGTSVSIIFGLLFYNLSNFGIALISVTISVLLILSKKRINLKKVYGAYAIAIMLGFLLSRLPFNVSINVVISLICAILLMDYASLQHAPALGIAISYVTNKVSFGTMFFISALIFMVFGLIYVLKIYLKNPKKLANIVEIEQEKVQWDFLKSDPELF
jgi:hypothetical protein